MNRCGVDPSSNRPTRIGARRDERGQITVLILGFAIVVLLLVAVVTNASKAYLAYRDLMALADAAALSAADGLGGDAYKTGFTGDTDIDPDAASRLVEEYVDTSIDRSAFPELQWTVEVAGDRVVVHMTTETSMPLTFPGTDGSTTVGADGSAIADIG